MKTCITLLGAVLILAPTASAWAQHEGHNMPGAAATTAANQATGNCAEETAEALPIIEQTQGRIDAARETNSAQALRSALDDAQAALADLKVKFAACQGAASQPQASAPASMASHAGHQMPGMSGTSGTSDMSGMSKPASGGSMDHSKMDHSTVDHSKMGHTMPTATPAATPADKMCPVSRMAGSERHTAEYQGKTYYFCSEEDRQKFVAHPEKYVAQEKPSR